MTGSVFFIAIVAIGVILVVVTGTPFLLIPVILIAFAAVLIPVVWKYVRGTHLDPAVDEPHGVPTSREASYEPVQEPRQP
jgi:hypothetical protein